MPASRNPRRPALELLGTSDCHPCPSPNLITQLTWESFALVSSSLVAEHKPLLQCYPHHAPHNCSLVRGN